jgi:hypothetical protein
MNPNPTQMDRNLRSLAEVQRHRNLRCTRYDKCLSACVNQGWAGFTCIACPLLRDSSAENELPGQAIRRVGER